MGCHLVQVDVRFLPLLVVLVSVVALVSVVQVAVVPVVVLLAVVVVLAVPVVAAVPAVVDFVPVDLVPVIVFLLIVVLNCLLLTCITSACRFYTSCTKLHLCCLLLCHVVNVPNHYVSHPYYPVVDPFLRLNPTRLHLLNSLDIDLMLR